MINKLLAIVSICFATPSIAAYVTVNGTNGSDEIYIGARYDGLAFVGYGHISMASGHHSLALRTEIS